MAVLDFHQLSEDAKSRWVGAALAESLLVDLSRVRGITIVERKYLKSVMQELKFSLSDLVDPQHAVQVGRLVSAKILVLGTYYTIQNRFAINARLVEVETGKILLAVKAQGPVESFFDVQRKLASDFLGQLRVGDPGVMGDTVSVGRRPSLAAYELFVAARDVLVRLDEPSLRKGIELLERSLDLDRNHAEAHSTLTWAYTQLGGSALGLAESHANSALRLDPSSPEVLLAAANLALERRDLAKASDYLRQLRAHADPSPMSLVVEAEVASRRGDMNQAIERCQQALRIDPNFALAHAELGYIYNRMGDLKRARRHLERSLQVDSRLGFAHREMGYLAAREGDVEGAKKAFLRASSLEPRQPSNHYNLAVIYYREGRRQLAQEALAEAMRLDPSNPSHLSLQKLIQGEKEGTGRSLEYWEWRQR